MQTLGFPRTWQTLCFINGGCGEKVFAHTNGFGDFVLFDNLGWPWPIHECYLDRFCQPASSINSYEIRTDALAEYRKTDENLPQGIPRTVIKNIRSMVALDHIGRPAKLIFGYVQDYVENRVERLVRDFGTLGEGYLRATLGNNQSQITIVTSDFESFTAYADLRNVVVKKKDIVAARLRAVRVLGVAKRDAIFLCDDLLLVHGRATS